MRVGNFSGMSKIKKGKIKKENEGSAGVQSEYIILQATLCILKFFQSDIPESAWASYEFLLFLLLLILVHRNSV